MVGKAEYPQPALKCERNVFLFVADGMAAAGSVSMIICRITLGHFLRAFRDTDQYLYFVSTMRPFSGTPSMRPVTPGEVLPLAVSLPVQS